MRSVKHAVAQPIPSATEGERYATTHSRPGIRLGRLVGLVRHGVAVPPTYDNTPNGLRVDLMRKITALHPGYFRIPGGNYLEGNTLSTYFNWKNTIGPIESRPGHDNSAWGYWSQDGMGLLEYLEMAEEAGAQPILAVFAGYTLNGSVVPQSQLAPYVQDALDEIQYAIGPTSSTYGAMRAADGHPAPFNLNYVEVGNEDFFDGSGSYNAYRFPMFYDAIKAAYPQLKIIATASVTSRTPDVIDDHYYSNDPSVIAGDAHAYDATSRSGATAVAVNVYLAGVSGVTGGTSTVLTGDPTAMNSIAHPTAVAPASQRVGAGTSGEEILRSRGEYSGRRAGRRVVRRSRLHK